MIITTEFGRRIYENASLGTDHGRGFAFTALGDRVRGGRMIGSWPIAAVDESTILGPGGLVPKVDFRDVFAEVLGSCQGLSTEECAAVFPSAPLTLIGLMA